MSEENLVTSEEVLLQEILGARLTSVQFVMDYLILGFDAKGALTTLVWPEVASQELTITFGTAGYRDSLCSLIEETVEAVEITKQRTLLISFCNRTLLRIPFDNRKQRGEKAIFAGSGNRLAVWW